MKLDFNNNVLRTFLHRTIKWNCNIESHEHLCLTTYWHVNILTVKEYNTVINKK